MKIILSVVLFNFILFYTVNAQWTPDVRLTNNSAGSFTGASSWSITSSGLYLHLTWQDDRDGNYEIYYKRSTDNGVTWGADTRFTNTTAISTESTISASGSNIHIVWRDGDPNPGYEIYYKRSTDNGATWGANILMSGGFSPIINAAGSTLHLAWLNSGEVYYKRSTNNGTTWGSDILLSTTSSGHTSTSIAVSGSFVHVVWMDDRDGQEEVYYKRSTNGGVNWGSDLRLSDLPSNSYNPCIGVSGSMVHVVWTDTRMGQQIYYKSSSNNGANWSADTRLSFQPYFMNKAMLNVSGSVVHVTWDNIVDIYYKRSQDNGVTWGNETIITNPPFGGNSENASACLSGTAIHVVWNDSRDGNYEIYYKHDVSGNVLPVEMAYFNSSVKENNVALNWGTTWELNNSGFEIERSNVTGIGAGEWKKVGFINGNGTTSEEKYYKFEDKKLAAGVYKYRLKQIDYNGNYEYHSLQGDVIVDAPKIFEVSQNYPNPSNPNTKIDFQIPIDGNISLRVYDIAGKEIAVLIDGFKTADFYSVEFDGSDLASGIYFYRIITKGSDGYFSKTMKMVLVK